MLLRVVDVSKSFDGVSALSGVSIEVAEGETVGIIGPNGSGKTTLFNVISGFLEPDAGDVYFDGREMRGVPPERIPGLGVARVFQAPQLCPALSLVENVALGAYHRSDGGLSSLLRSWTMTVDMKAVSEALHLMDLEGRRDAPPASLSNFERRKAEVARAFVARPKLLLLDEPTSGFSQSERDAFTEAVGTFARAGITTMIVEHDLSLIRKTCGRVVVLDAGKKVADGTPDAVSKDPKVSEIYVGTAHVAG